MSMVSQELSGLDRIRTRFLHLLKERQANVAQHAMLAWESDDAATKRSNFQEAQMTLHQIAGTAGSLGFGDLGQTARECEDLIITYLDGPAFADNVLLNEIFTNLDAFVSKSQNLISHPS